ncbi:hypothetical protein ZWY2020_058973 [Hordeum vulgare]|nr:hypothetical protein ZWY2020_058973 [Hordeum vulgare]
MRLQTRRWKAKDDDDEEVVYEDDDEDEEEDDLVYNSPPPATEAGNVVSDHINVDKSMRCVAGDDGEEEEERYNEYKEKKDEEGNEKAPTFDLRIDQTEENNSKDDNTTEFKRVANALPTADIEWGIDQGNLDFKEVIEGAVKSGIAARV